MHLDTGELGDSTRVHLETVLGSWQEMVLRCTWGQHLGAHRDSTRKLGEDSRSGGSMLETAEKDSSGAGRRRSI